MFLLGVNSLNVLGRFRYDMLSTVKEEKSEVDPRVPMEDQATIHC